MVVTNSHKQGGQKFKDDLRRYKQELQKAPNDNVRKTIQKGKTMSNATSAQDDPFINPDGTRYEGPIDYYGKPMRSATDQEVKRWKELQEKRKHMTQKQIIDEVCEIPEHWKIRPVTQIGKVREACGLPWLDADNEQEAKEKAEGKNES